MESRAIHKSKQYIVMGACFPASLLFFSVISLPKEMFLLPVRLFVSLFMCWEVGSCELVYVRRVPIS